MRELITVAELHFIRCKISTDAYFYVFSTPFPLFMFFQKNFKLLIMHQVLVWVQFSTSSFFLLPCVKEKHSLLSEVPHLACSVYYSALKDLPAMVRLWWNSQDKRVVSIVDKFTSKYVSSVLSAQEISLVQSSTQTFDSMTVRHCVVNTNSSFYIL